MSDLEEAIVKIKQFKQNSLRRRIASLENKFSTPKGNDKDTSQVLSAENGIDLSLLNAALMIKLASSQIDEVVHSVGILLLLPHILEEGETVESLSLGAGNAPDRLFDLETNRRIAEFKFVNWRGADSVRKKTTFKDFCRLCEADTDKRRYLYVIGGAHLLRFLNGKSRLQNVINRGNQWKAFEERHQNRFTTVQEYYVHHQHNVSIVDITQYIPMFASLFDIQHSENS